MLGTILTIAGGLIVSIGGIISAKKQNEELADKVSENIMSKLETKKSKEEEA